MAYTAQGTGTLTTTAGNVTIAHAIGRTPHMLHIQLLAAVTGAHVAEVSKDPTFAVVNGISAANVGIRITAVFLPSHVR